MSLENLNVIDAITINDKTGNIEILIDDNFDFSNEGKHIEMLQNKLRVYLNFILAGQLFNYLKSPEDMQRNIAVVIRFSYEPTPNTIEILEFNKISFHQHKVILTWVVELKS